MAVDGAVTTANICSLDSLAGGLFYRSVHLSLRWASGAHRRRPLWHLAMPNVGAVEIVVLVGRVCSLLAGIKRCRSGFIVAGKWTFFLFVDWTLRATERSPGAVPQLAESDALELVAETLASYCDSQPTTRAVVHIGFSVEESG